MHRCADCPTEVSATAERCRACNMRRVAKRQRATPRLSTAERQASFRARRPERAKEIRDRARQKKKEILAEIKRKAGCARCGIRDPRVLDFHHKDPGEKVLAVSQLVAAAGWQTVMDEVARCSVLCANCHRIAHAEDGEDVGCGIAARG